MRKEDNDYTYNPDKYRQYLDQLREKEDSEIDMIITRYSLYEPLLVDAALYIAVERGLISFELKEKLAAQIKFNLSETPDYRKQKTWEKNNAFAGYASRYSDDELYEIIDNPSNRIIDAYHGVLQAALGRELISEEDFRDLFGNALNALRSEEEIRREETDAFLRDILQEDEEISDEKAEAERALYWKCPNCGENIEMNFAVCWNCNTPVPENPEHPDKEEIKKELSFRLPPKRSRIGVALFVVGLLIMGIEYLRVHFHLGFWRLRYINIVIGGIAAAAGLIILIWHLLIPEKK